MESRKVFTKAMLQEECGVTEVTNKDFTRYVQSIKSKKWKLSVTKPTLMLQKSWNKDYFGYVGLTVSLYNYKTKSYVNMPFSKLRWIWENGECPMGVVIDHIDTNPLNNEMSNLRLLTEKDNQKNRKIWKPFTIDEITPEMKDVEILREEIYKRMQKTKQNIV